MVLVDSSIVLKFGSSAEDSSTVGVC